MSHINPPAANGVTIVYDGECPLCNSYVRHYRIREFAGQVRLVDARSADPIVEEISRLGLDLDEGMAVQINGRLYHGADAIHVLAILGSGGTVFNRLNRSLFRHPRIARYVYPVLARGRVILLRLLGRTLIADD